MFRADAKEADPMSRTREAKTLSLEPPTNVESFSFSDDIDCKAWLTEINLAQYAETFLVNLSSDNKYVRRKRLNQLRQQDLAKMNITNYAHQKRLMEHVRLVQKFPFNSPHRKKEIKDLYIEPVKTDLFDAKGGDNESEGKGSSHAKSSLGHHSKHHTAQSKEQAHLEKKKQARRRRSFDADVWNSISNMRKKSVANQVAVDHLRQGFFSHTDDDAAQEKKGPAGERRGSFQKESGDAPKRDRAQRWSFHGSDGAAHTAHVTMAMEKAKAVMYGNLALEYDIMLTNLHTLQTEYLNKFKETLNCEVASLFFVNNSSRELLLCSHDSRWFRIPFGTGICGYCLETGENVNIADAYSDYRFNKNMDLKTGFKTRNILCQPIRGMRGGGAIIAVIQMLNKIGGDAFDANDEELLSTFTGKVADVLTVRFTDLISIADKFAGQGIFVGQKGGAMGEKPANYQSHTHASSSKHSENVSPRGRADD